MLSKEIKCKPPADELKLLDLKQCDSVGDIVLGMGHCSFGARMLGEVTLKLSQWIQANNPPVAVYDGRPDDPLGQLLTEMVKQQWFSQVVSQQYYASQTAAQETVVVIGAYSASFEKVLACQAKKCVFINRLGLALPGQLADGYFPDVVFCDPTFALPVMFASLDEMLTGKATTASQLMQQLAHYGGLGTDVSRAAQTLLAMVNDDDCRVFLTLSGAMTIAKMGLVICDMIDLGMVDAICTTGALMAHGLVESVGLKHFKYNPNANDANLAQQKLNRVTDTLEPETNLDHIGDIITQLFEQYDGNDCLSPRLFCHHIGEYLAAHYPHERGILKSAYEQDIPVIIPAFHDSELGNDIYLDNHGRKRSGRKPITFDMELDTAHLLNTALQSSRLGIFTIGGGVPRNFTQNIPCLIDRMNQVAGANLPSKQFSYGCRICPDPMYYGHLSGCTYSEGMSWRKMDIHGHFSEVRADATQIWPFLVKFVMEA